MAEALPPQVSMNNPNSRKTKSARMRNFS